LRANIIDKLFVRRDRPWRERQTRPMEKDAERKAKMSQIQDSLNKISQRRNMIEN
jgi:hypothetical protein